MKTPAAIACSLLLAGCNATARTDSPPKRTDMYVGKTLYTRGDNVQFCDAPRDFLKPATAKCVTLKAGAAVVINDLVKAGSSENYAGTDGTGRQGFLTSIDVLYMDGEEVYRAKAAEKAECDRKGGVRVGMTRAQVLASCWGKPERTNVTVTADGRREQLVYGLRSYVYLQDGVVSAIQAPQ